jgi:hypothetical protein
MNEYIIKEVKAFIGDKQSEWARMFIVKANQSRFDTPEAKKEVDAATHRMGMIEDELNFLEGMLKDYGTKTKGKK